MLGLAFVRDERERQTGLTWRTAILPIPGKRPLTVGLSSDDHGCSRLSAALFACSTEEVDHTMMNDALCQLVNMMAGLLKRCMSLDQPLGLPEIVVGQGAPMPPPQSPHVITLTAGPLDLVLWIYEGLA
jgi:hypothetical protein